LSGQAAEREGEMKAKSIGYLIQFRNANDINPMWITANVSEENGMWCAGDSPKFQATMFNDRKVARDSIRKEQRRDKDSGCDFEYRIVPVEAAHAD
jgi:hypothetical protein